MRRRITNDRFVLAFRPEADAATRFSRADRCADGLLKYLHKQVFISQDSIGLDAKRCAQPVPARKLKRAAEPPANRIAVEDPIGYPIVADYFGSSTFYFGSSTLSITWITPLLWYTLAMVTLALLPFASVTVTLLPIALNVSGSPCTVV